jgi:hypothetical protein
MSLPFDEIWLVNFEFEAAPGESPVPICLVALEYKSGRSIRQWLDGKHLSSSSSPYPTHGGSLFVAFYASAELGCHLALDWPLPERVLDLFVEFRNRTNGLNTPCGAGLLGALTYFGLNAGGAAEKKEMQEAIGNGTWRGRYSPEEILDYCESDVRALARLLPVMAPEIDLPRALLRGRYMAAAARIERNGVPVDVPLLERLRAQWEGLQDALICEIDRDYGCYDGRTFKQDRFEQYLTRQGLPWVRLDTGRLDLSDETFRQMARTYPQVAPLRELRSSLSELRLNDLAVGRDGRNRAMLSAFRARTGRNQPSNSKFIFGPSVWLRGLIKPPPGYGAAYVDWEQQEFGIAAALSADPNMRAAYHSGDPYLAFAKQAGGQPSQREPFKQCALGVLYGMEAQALAMRIGQPLAMAQYLIQAHRETYRRFWQWSDAAVDHAMLNGELRTVYGWTIHVGPDTNPRSLRNFPMQANGAEMLRLACIFAAENGVEVCAPVHDALLICAPLDHIISAVVEMQECMRRASRHVIKFELRTEANVVRYPNRYMDEKRGRVMFDRVMGLLNTEQKVVAA